MNLDLLLFVAQPELYPADYKVFDPNSKVGILIKSDANSGTILDCKYYGELQSLDHQPFVDFCLIVVGSSVLSLASRRESHPLLQALLVHLSKQVMT